MKMLNLLVVGTLVSLSCSLSFAEEKMKADAEAINSACATDSATASCGADKVGTGLLKCLHKYKKENKAYKFTDGCKAAMKQMHADRKAK